MFQMPEPPAGRGYSVALAGRRYKAVIECPPSKLLAVRSIMPLELIANIKVSVQHKLLTGLGEFVLHQAPALGTLGVHKGPCELVLVGRGFDFGDWMG